MLRLEKENEILQDKLSQPGGENEGKVKVYTTKISKLCEIMYSGVEL